jgi:hypothetical protein
MQRDKSRAQGDDNRPELTTRPPPQHLNRTTRSVAPTEAGMRLFALRLNVPAHIARVALPRIIVPFLEALSRHSA